jgi:hypothetical protein
MNGMDMMSVEHTKYSDLVWESQENISFEFSDNEKASYGVSKAEYEENIRKSHYLEYEWDMWDEISETIAPPSCDALLKDKVGQEYIDKAKLEFSGLVQALYYHRAYPYYDTGNPLKTGHVKPYNVKAVIYQTDDTPAKNRTKIYFYTNFGKPENAIDDKALEITLDEDLDPVAIRISTETKSAVVENVTYTVADGLKAFNEDGFEIPEQFRAAVSLLSKNVLRKDKAEQTKPDNYVLKWDSENKEAVISDRNVDFRKYGVSKEEYNRNIEERFSEIVKLGMGVNFVDSPTRDEVRQAGVEQEYADKVENILGYFVEKICELRAYPCAEVGATKTGHIEPYDIRFFVSKTDDDPSVNMAKAYIHDSFGHGLEMTLDEDADIVAIKVSTATIETTLPPDTPYTETAHIGSDFKLFDAKGVKVPKIFVPMINCLVDGGFENAPETELKRHYTERTPIRAEDTITLYTTAKIIDVEKTGFGSYDVKPYIEKEIFKERESEARSEQVWAEMENNVEIYEVEPQSLTGKHVTNTAVRQGYTDTIQQMIRDAVSTLCEAKVYPHDTEDFKPYDIEFCVFKTDEETPKDRAIAYIRSFRYKSTLELIFDEDGFLTGIKVSVSQKAIPSKDGIGEEILPDDFKSLDDPDAVIPPLFKPMINWVTKEWDDLTDRGLINPSYNVPNATGKNEKYNPVQSCAPVYTHTHITLGKAEEKAAETYAKDFDDSDSFESFIEKPAENDGPAEVIIRRSNGKEEVVREVSDDFNVGNLLFADDYFARLLWNKADIGSVLESYGYAGIKTNVEAVLDAISKNYGFSAFCETEAGFEVIENAMKDVEQNLVTAKQVTKKTAQIIIRNEDGSEEVLREVDATFDKDHDILFKEDYANVLWTEKDIAKALEENGFEGTDKNISIVFETLAANGAAKTLKNNSAGLHAVYDAIYQAGDVCGKLTGNSGKPSEKSKKKDTYEKNS